MLRDPGVHSNGIHAALGQMQLEAFAHRFGVQVAICGSDGGPVPQAVWEWFCDAQLPAVALTAAYLGPHVEGEILRHHLDSGGPVPANENPGTGLR